MEEKKWDEMYLYEVTIYTGCPQKKKQKIQKIMTEAVSN